MNIFINELCNIASVSYEYADAAWYTLNDYSRENPKLAARRYARLYLIN